MPLSTAPSVLACWILALSALCSSSHGEKKSVGDISSVFNSMSGEEYNWPRRYMTLKEQIKPPKEVLSTIWAQLLADVERKAAEISKLQQNAIPVVGMDEVVANHGRLPENVAQQVAQRGVVVLRNVVDEETARSWKQGTEAYAAENPTHTGYPQDDPQVLELYWSKPQVHARQHPRVHDAILACNRMWSASSSEEVSFEHVLTYGERLRIRKPGDTSFTLGAHIDGGSIERFENPEYRSVYKKIFDGNWKEYNPWNGNFRALSNSSMYTTSPNGAATIFRSFQGWLAVSAIGPVPNAGTLRVVPMVKESISYLLLRPFLDDVEADDFLGAFPGKGQDLMDKYHGPLIEALVPIPDMKPGDMVFWHPDLVHAVEHIHAGIEDSSVFYIPAMPLTRANALYLSKQRDRFEEGKTPPDFPPNDSEVDFTNRGKFTDLTQLGRRMLGFEKFEEQSTDVSSGINSPEEGCTVEEFGALLIEDCNKILGF